VGYICKEMTEYISYGLILRKTFAAHYAQTIVNIFKFIIPSGLLKAEKV